MRAAFLENPAPIETEPLMVVDIPAPDPGPGQVRIGIEACGICHTDLHTVEGEIPMIKRPVVPGHQVVGIVKALGEGVTEPRVGDRVGVPWLHSTCGRCRHCAGGSENLCDEALFTGLSADGGYAEAMLAPAAFVHPLPPGLDPVHAAPLLCAGVIGYRALRLSEVAKGETLALFGFGASAHVVLQIAVHRGIRTIVFSRGQAHRELAAKLGAVWTGLPTERPPEPADRAILFAPAGALVPMALSALRKGGTLAIASIYLDGFPAMDYGRLLYGERTVRSVTAATRLDARELLDLAARVPLRTTVEVFGLVMAGEALCRLKQGKVNGAAVLVPQARDGSAA
jgi:propanol-preferring alcohol dehydrogenase